MSKIDEKAFGMAVDAVAAKHGGDADISVSVLKSLIEAYEAALAKAPTAPTEPQGWQPIERWDEETYKDKWVSFTDGQAVATRLIFPPMAMGFALSFSPTHFQVVVLPRANAVLEAPTIDHANPPAAKAEGSDNG